ncbi:hypothetical protein WJX74_009004 [Apatococcus lobatus]|uniref:Uncharacterized protein n=1 Tax=Apatococcus lobatus TaxID=904363 RepID=A0AAW1RI32_9CHLO
MSTLLEGRTTRRTAEQPGPALERLRNRGNFTFHPKPLNSGRQKKRAYYLQPGHVNEHYDRDAKRRKTQLQAEASLALEQDQQAVADNAVHHGVLQRLTAEQLEVKRQAAKILELQAGFDPCSPHDPCPHGKEEKEEHAHYNSTEKGTPAYKQALRRRSEKLVPALEDVQAPGNAALGEILVKAVHKLFIDDPEGCQEVIASFGEASGLTLSTYKSAVTIIQESWVPCGMKIKHGMTIHVPNEAFDQLRNMLGFSYDAQTDKYTRRLLYSQQGHTNSLRTVSFPVLPSLYAVNMAGKEEMAKFDPETSEDGVACTLDVVKTADWILQHSDSPVPPGIDVADLQPQDRIPGLLKLLLAGDECRWQSSKPCTTMGIQGVGLQEKGSKIGIAATHSILLMEAHDSSHCFAEYGKRVINDVRQLQQHGLERDGQQVPVYCLGGGDYKYLGGIMGISTATSRYLYLYCVGEQEHIRRAQVAAGTPASSRLAPAQLRTLKQACHLAHAEPPWLKDEGFRPFKCPAPACGKEFHTREAVDAEAAELASWGPEDKDPSKTKRGKHRDSHLGQELCRSALFDICHQDMIVDTLHLKLNLQLPKGTCAPGGGCIRVQLPSATCTLCDTAAGAGAPLAAAELT